MHINCVQEGFMLSSVLAEQFHVWFGHLKVVFVSSLMSYILGKLVWGNFMTFHSYFQNAEIKPWSHLQGKHINDNAIIIESHNHRITE